MHYVVGVLRTSQGVRFNLPTHHFEREVLQWAQDNLHAPKMGKENGRITTERGDPYYAHMPTVRSFIFHRSFEHVILNIIERVAVGFNLPIKIVKEDVVHTAPFPCVFDNYGFDMVVEDPESRFFYQNEVVDRAMLPERKQIIFAIQTGRGKTKTSQKVMVKRKVRTALVHRPSYVDKWLYDCCKDPTGLMEDRSVVHVAKGVDGIYDLYELGRSGELDRRGIKIVIIPTVSLMLFLKEWMATAHSNPVDLEQFFNVIGVGEVVFDEIHEHFRLVYLCGIMMNPPATVEMSATLKPSKAKAFIGARYLERFPMEARVSVPYIPVVDVRAVLYKIEHKKLQGYASWMSPYNHKLVEAKMISMDVEITYFDMVYEIMERSFLANFQGGQKALVMFVTVEMCERFLKYLRGRLDKSIHSHLMAVKYNAGDSYDAFMDADIGVSTPGKSGTAIDIPGLVHAYITPPISDDQLNEQIAGRPRATTQWENLTPKVWFFHCAGVPKHMTYLENRRESLTPMVKSFQTAMSNYVIRNPNATAPTTYAPVSAVRGLKPFKFHKRSPARLPRRGKRR